MARRDDDIWYRLGYALERSRDRLRGVGAGPDASRRGSPGKLLRSLSERTAPSTKAREAGRRRSRTKNDPERDEGPGVAGDGGVGGLPPQVVETLLATGAGTLVARILDLWTPRRSPGIGGLLRAGLAGAGASLGRHLIRSLMDDRSAPELDEEMVEVVAAGAARGLLYAAVVEPRLIGPAPVRGAVFGVMEYAVSPWGGLTTLLGRGAPHRKIPLLQDLFEGYDPGDDTLVDHVAFAVALAVLYGVEDHERDGEG